MHPIVTELRTVNLTRYVTPLREGGSMPAIAEADDGFLYVVKFKGAGQGCKALIAELIGGELARLLGLKVPELVFVTLDEAFGRTEGDEEIQDLLKASTGLNLALHYLSGSISFDPIVYKVEDKMASLIVCLDSILMNMDRTARNTNMLWWNKELWLIDHGAALYFHHSGNPWTNKASQPFELIQKHVLLPQATQFREAFVWIKQNLTAENIRKIIDQIPAVWLEADLIYATIEEQRNAYGQFILDRLEHSENLIKEIENAKK
ncbi:MAG: aminotransferase class I and II [Bacteroidia bacterium]|nr:aminotransferase class I and II [Bacteroidia bacterium]MCF8425159.1 aminotransferase class I and II [Bacteroidia bacterium]